MKDIEKGVFKFVLLIIVIDILFISLTFKQLVKNKDSFKMLVNKSSVYLVSNPINDPLLPYKLLEIVYNDIQYRHVERNDVDIELFKQLVEIRQLKLARHAALHNINDCNNLKYLTLDGKDEFIVKVEYKEDGEIIFLELVNDPVNRGTYNLFNQEGPWITRRLHKVDVYLWLLYGTGGNDTTSIVDRLIFYQSPPTSCEVETEEGS